MLHSSAKIRPIIGEYECVWLGAWHSGTRLGYKSTGQGQAPFLGLEPNTPYIYMCSIAHFELSLIHGLDRHILQSPLL